MAERKVLSSSTQEKHLEEKRSTVKLPRFLIAMAQALQQDPGANTEELADRLGWKKGTTRECIRLLYRAFDVRRSRGFGYKDQREDLLQALATIPYELKKRKEKSNKPTLSSRQIEIVRLAAMGYDNNRIAKELTLSGKTVINRFSNIEARLNASDRTTAVLTSIKLNLIDISELTQGFDLGLFQQISPSEEKVLEDLSNANNTPGNKQIGQRLSLSASTIHYHLINIYTKLDVNNRTSAALFYLAIQKQREKLKEATPSSPAFS